MKSTWIPSEPILTVLDGDIFSVRRVEEKVPEKATIYKSSLRMLRRVCVGAQGQDRRRKKPLHSLLGNN